MTIVQIPTDAAISAFEETVNLEGVDYLLRTYWNTRDESWYMDIFTPDKTPIICGLKLVDNYDFTGFYVQDNVPPGMFMLYDDANSEKSCSRYDLGNNYILIYISSDDEFLSQ